VLLHHAPAAAAGRTGEPVHQMRVALRRLRALASVFGAAVDCPEMRALRPELKLLASALGPARDWDVFLAGTGPAVAEAFAGEAELAALLAEAEARRAEAYADLAALLDGPVLRMLALRVAVMAQARPWRETGAPVAGDDTGGFGAGVLARRWRRLARRASGTATMPEAELHEMRLKAKRLRYAAELFAPLHPGRGAKRFLKRLAGLQEALGHLNDGVVAGALMRELADSGGTGLAGGLVRGFVAGRAADARAEIGRAWRRLRKVGPFWG
jgi:CHAD domain-containing protein